MRFILLVLSFISFPVAAFAESIPQTITLSSGLVDEIARILAARPYSEVAVTISKLQAEIKPQLAPKPDENISKPAPEKKPLTGGK